jgi:hypothetical protein
MGPGDDRLSVGYTQGLSSIYMDVLGVAGGDGNDELVISDVGSMANHPSVFIQNRNIQGLTPGGGQIAIGSDFEVMGLTLGGGTTSIEVVDPSIPLTIRGTNGRVSVTVTSLQGNQSVTFYGGSTGDRLYVGDVGSARNVYGSVTFFGGAGDDEAWLYELAGTGSVWFEGGAGNDSLNVWRYYEQGTLVGLTAGDVDGRVVFLGGEGTDALTVKETLYHMGGVSVSFDSATLPETGQTAGLISGLDMAQGIHYVAEGIRLDLGPAGTNQSNKIYVDATSEETEDVLIVGSMSKEEFYIGHTTGRQLTEIHGQITLLGNGGYLDSLSISNADSSDGWDDAVLTANSFIGMGLSNPIVFSGMAWVSVTMGNGADEIWLESIPYVDFPVGYGRDHSYATINNLGDNDTVFMTAQVADMVLSGHWKVNSDSTPMGIKADSPETVTQPELPSGTVTVINSPGYPVLASQGTVTYSSSSGSYRYYTWQATSSVDQDVVVYTQWGYGGGLRFATVFHVDITNIPPEVTMADQTIDEGGTPTFTITDPGMAAGEPFTCYWEIVDNATGVKATSDLFSWDSQPPFPAVAGNYQGTLFVTDSEVTRSASATLTVNNVAPTADAGPDVEGELLAVDLSGSVTDPGTAGGGTVSCQWVVKDAGGNEVARNDNLVWTFLAPALGSTPRP